MENSGHLTLGLVVLSRFSTMSDIIFSSTTKLITKRSGLDDLGDDRLGDGIGRVDFDQVVLFGLQERERSQSEESVEDIDSVAGAIADPSFFVLAVEDVLLERFLVDPVFSVHHAEGRVDPPRVANVGKFLWAAIKATFVCLPLAQPLCQHLLVKRIDGSQYFKGSHATEDVG